MNVLSNTEATNEESLLQLPYIAISLSLSATVQF